jgi:hypothetical protein
MNAQELLAVINASPHMDFRIIEDITLPPGEATVYEESVYLAPDIHQEIEEYMAHAYN